MDTSTLDDINGWVQYVSPHGVQVLTIAHQFDEEHGFPLSVFECVELRHLTLKFVELELPPHNFREFSSLVSLTFFNVTLPGDILTNIISKCPLLERLRLDFYVTKFQSGRFVLTSPKLKFLSINYCYYIDFNLEYIPNISTLVLEEKGDPAEGMNKCQDIVQFFGAVSNVETIKLPGNLLSGWVAHEVPERLPAPLENHSTLIVLGLNLLSLVQIRSLFCLIESSPNLESLIISVYQGDAQLHDAEDYLHLQPAEAANVWSMKYLNICGFTETGPGIVLIQVILSCCPMLEKLFLRSAKIESHVAEIKMMSEIMRFSRASTKAEIIYSTPM